MRSCSKLIRRARPLLGTLVEICAEGGPDAEASVQNAFTKLARVQALMSTFEKNSDVSRINNLLPGQTLVIDHWTYGVLARAIEINKLTDGLFDCTVQARRRSRGRPSGLGRVSSAGIELLPESTVRIHRVLALTLDGIAKGFAVDIAVETLIGAGISSGVVNAGGDLRLFGNRAEPVYVRVPNAPGKFCRIGPYSNRAVASSANYFGNSPLTNPHTGRQVDYSYGMTVVADDCMTADALTKPCLLSPGRAQCFAGAFGARAIFMRPAENN